MTQRSNLLTEFESVYWRPKPHRLGAHGMTMMAPLIAAAIGDVCFTALGLASLNDALTPMLQQGLEIVGSFAVAVGAALGTLPTVVEIFRFSERPERVDQACLYINVFTAFAGLTLGLAAMLAQEARWYGFVREWGSLVFGALVTLDSITAATIFGRYLRSFDGRFQEWQTRFEDDAQRWAAWQGLTISPEAQSGAMLPPEADALPLPANASSEAAPLDFAPSEPGANSSEPSTADQQTPSEPAALTCPYCGASANREGKPFRSQQALSGHMAHCSAKHSLKIAERKE